MSNDSPLRLRAADEIRPGVFATDLLVFTGAHEFVLDFVQNLEVPIRVVARVVVPRPALAAMVDVMRQGVVAPQAQMQAEPAAAGESAPAVNAPTTIAQPKQVYDDIKVPESVQSGAYASALVTAHNDQIFRFDFVAQFCPEPVLTARVFMTKAQAAQVLATLEHAGRGGK